MQSTRFFNKHSIVAIVIASFVCAGIVSAQETVLPPAAITAKQVGTAQQITIEWGSSPSAGVEAYRLYRTQKALATDPGETLVSRRITNQYYDNDVLYGETYYYTVAAISGTAISGVSVVATSTLTVPKVKNLTARAITKATEVELRWDSPLPGLEVRYDVYRATTPHDPDGTRVRSSLRDEVYIDTKVASGTTYYYWVVARIDKGVSLASTKASVAINDDFPPAAPTSVRARTDKEGEVRLTWGAPKDERNLSYAVYRSTSSGTSGTKQGVTSSRSYTQTGLRDGAVYYYRVVAIDAVGNTSRESDSVSVTIQNDFGAELYVHSVAAEGTGKSGAIRLRWKNPNRNTFKHNEIYRSTRATDIGSLIADKVRGTSYGDSGRANGTTYYYTIISVNDAGRTTNKGVTVFATPYDKKNKTATSKNAPPGVRKIRAQDLGDAQSIQLTWTNPAIHTYETVSIYRSTERNVLGTAVVRGIRQSSYIDTKNIDSDTFYYYTVKTLDKSNNESTDNVTTRGVATAHIAGEGGGVDSDGDGLVDAWERAHGFHVRFRDQLEEDHDGDGLTLGEEFENQTDPWDTDSDDDGFDDATEVFNGYNPNGPGRKSAVAISRSTIVSGEYAYNKSRLGSLAQEQALATELRAQLEAMFGRNRIPNPRAHWPTLVNAYVYGGYTAEEIAHTLRQGPGLVHPTVPAETWRQGAEYQRKS